MLHLCEGPELRMRYLEDRDEKKKFQQPAGLEPTTSKVLIPKHVLYCCATTAANVDTFLMPANIYAADRPYFKT